ncbi:hypothetical protein MJO28_009514 [Puccinia striiformis f. sp. tritici]|uniref:Uncharacterized protein n=3 Tax=Puccinia striiformis TaxID=27350 RepID=A0A0L0V6P7_9BASI|nr:hypothetical protein Pst134EB_018523 [Puccinia striiformis f. sp. tritici]KAI7947606.1 hypothetical protein MJO28_009514 [Puccinia striiformis f. sp. tritici]KAI7950616.1 hypothetical protein MJO29_009290 [Puccinia striiformis f. sp. tritici]KNE94955.1 hypothetical protein PSTG_11746 [Puccinia striiformis f. sp. tritici PST-78]POV98759.1 hypothetical protein PSTT_14203 [Puccinia striiformis]
MPPSELLTNSNLAAKRRGHQVWIGGKAPGLNWMAASDMNSDVVIQASFASCAVLHAFYSSLLYVAGLVESNATWRLSRTAVGTLGNIARIASGEVYHPFKLAAYIRSLRATPSHSVKVSMFM